MADTINFLERIGSLLDVAQFLLGDAAYAAGISTNSLKAWLSREPRVISLGEHDQMAFGKGSSRILTLRRVVHIALAAELVKLAVAPQRAGHLSMLMTDGVGREVSFSNTKARSENTTPFNYEVVNIWTNEDVWIAIERDKDNLYVTRSSSTIGDMTREMAYPNDDFDVRSCILINFTGVLQSTIAKLIEKGRLS